MMSEPVGFRFHARRGKHSGTLCDRDDIAVMHSLLRLVEPGLCFDPIQQVPHRVVQGHMSGSENSS
jgi:hypothetical protein